MKIIERDPLFEKYGPISFWRIFRLVCSTAFLATLVFLILYRS